LSGVPDDKQAVSYCRREFKNWRLEIPDFAYDKYTQKDGQMGRGVEDWRQEGCKLPNEVTDMNHYEAEATELRETTGRISKGRYSLSDLFEE
jgi:hypothetical protein